MPRFRFFAFGSLALLAAACSSTEKSNDQETGQNSTATHCTAMRDACLQKQLTCESKAGVESCVACPSGQYASDPDTCTPIPGLAMSHDFGTYDLKANDEIDPLCQSWTLHNEDELWVNGVELTTNGGYHHSNWLFVTDDKYAGPDGAWMCDERGYDELSAAVAGGVLFAQSTQARHQVQKFQDGVAVHLPPHTRIIGGTHLLNTSDKDLQTTLAMSIYTLPASDVKVPLAPFRLSYLDLTIPPHAISDFSGTCDFSAPIPNGTPGDLDMDVYYVMPHYHVLGHSFHLETYGGPNDGKTIFDVGEFDGEAHGTPIDPPISMRGSKGFRFTCGFENPRDQQVGWGIGDQEMCVMLGFARSDYAFDASVAHGAATGMKNNEAQYSGACAVLPLPFARGKGSLSPDPSKRDAGIPSRDQ